MLQDLNGWPTAEGGADYKRELGNIFGPAGAVDLRATLAAKLTNIFQLIRPFLSLVRLCRPLVAAVQAYLIIWEIN